MIASALPLPTVQDWLNWVWQREPIVGLWLILIGLALMLIGWRIFKLVVVVTFALFGAWLAGQWTANVWINGVLAVLGAVGLGLVSWPLMKYAVAVLGGAAGALVLVWLVAKVTSQTAAILIAAGAGFAALAALSAVMFTHVVIFVTSLQGGLLIATGLAVAARFSSTLFAHVQALAQQNWLFLPLLIVTPTVVGVCLQLADLQRKESGNPTD